MVNIENKTTVKVLGLIWKTETDEIIFDMTELIEFVKNKKRNKENHTAVSCTHILPSWLPVTIQHQRQMFISANVGKGP